MCGAHATTSGGRSQRAAGRRGTVRSLPAARCSLHAKTVRVRRTRRDSPAVRWDAARTRAGRPAVGGVADVVAALQIRGAAAEALSGLRLARPSATVTPLAADGRHVGPVAAHRLPPPPAALPAGDARFV